ncbi:MAG TPA: RNA polymerase sigma factor [Vicinamibacterales bacterium]|nr:RNA polymerase sigma factor [Vicinamibacterales bacterium]
MTATDAAEVPDLDLVRRAQDGDAAAFGELVERHRRAVFRAAVAATRNPAEADDVAQEAFVTAYRKLSGFRGDSSFRTWMLSIAWRKALDRRKSVARWLRMTVTPGDAAETTADMMDRVPAAARSQEDALAAAELQKALRRLIQSLPRKLRDALLLAGSGEYSYDEIGQMLGVPVGTVKWRVSEARRVLKQKLASIGHAGRAGLEGRGP